METRTINIPGGTAEPRQKLNVGQRQDVMRAGAPAAQVSARVQAEGGDPANVTMSSAEVGALIDAQNLTVFNYLVSWTIEDPFPQSVPDVLSMDPDVYDAIVAEVGTSSSGVDTSSALTQKPLQTAQYPPMASPRPRSPRHPWRPRTRSALVRVPVP